METTVALIRCCKPFKTTERYVTCREDGNDDDVAMRGEIHYPLSLLAGGGGGSKKCGCVISGDILCVCLLLLLLVCAGAAAVGELLPRFYVTYKS